MMHALIEVAQLLLESSADPAWSSRTLHVTFHACDVGRLPPPGILLLLPILDAENYGFLEDGSENDLVAMDLNRVSFSPEVRTDMLGRTALVATLGDFWWAWTFQMFFEAFFEARSY